MAKFQVRFQEEKCKGCELCTAVCPKQLIAVSSHMNSKGYFIMAIEKMEDCIGCTSCALICPDGAITIEREEA